MGWRRSPRLLRVRGQWKPCASHLLEKRKQPGSSLSLSLSLSFFLCSSVFLPLIVRQIYREGKNEEEEEKEPLSASAYHPSSKRLFAIRLFPFFSMLSQVLYSSFSAIRPSFFSVSVSVSLSVCLCLSVTQAWTHTSQFFLIQDRFDSFIGC